MVKEEKTKVIQNKGVLADAKCLKIRVYLNKANNNFNNGEENAKYEI